jgi:hypothetical protein
MKRLGRRLGLVIAIASLGVLAVAPAFAQYPGPDPTLRFANGAISGSNWCAGSTVRLFLDGERIGSVAVGSDGTFSVDLDVPAGTEAGSHELSAEGLRVDCTTPWTESITIVLSAEDVAFTGVDGGGLSLGVVLAVGLALAGGGLLAVSRRRRTGADA